MLWPKFRSSRLFSGAVGEDAWRADGDPVLGGGSPTLWKRALTLEFGHRRHSDLDGPGERGPCRIDATPDADTPTLASYPYSPTRTPSTQHQLP